MSQRKIYMVTSGSYSDYQMECAFETREAAEAYAGHRDWMDVEEVTQYSDGEEPVYHTLWIASQGFNWHTWDCEGRPGQVTNRIMSGPVPVPPERPHAVFCDVVYQPDGTVNTDPTVNVTGYDRDHVVKALHDRVAQVRAEKLGL